MSWNDLACAYAAAKWPYAAPNHRRGIADTLADVTEVLIRADAKVPDREDLRRVLRGWAVSAHARDGGEPPHDLAPVVRWVEDHSITLAELAKDDGSRDRPDDAPQDQPKTRRRPRGGKHGQP